MYAIRSYYGVERDPLAVGRPARHPIHGRVAGELPQAGAVGVHDVEMALGLDQGIEHDLLAVGRRLWVAPTPRPRGQPDRLTANRATDRVETDPLDVASYNFV